MLRLLKFASVPNRRFGKAVISSEVSIHEALAEMNTNGVEKSPSVEQEDRHTNVLIFLLNRRGFLDSASLHVASLVPFSVARNDDDITNVILSGAAPRLMLAHQNIGVGSAQDDIGKRVIS
jgi:hypothetical protein